MGLACDRDGYDLRAKQCSQCGSRGCPKRDHCRTVPVIAPGIYDRVNETPNSFILKSRIHVDDIRMRSERAFWDRMLAVPNRLYGVTINDEGEAI